MYELYIQYNRTRLGEEGYISHRDPQPSLAATGPDSIHPVGKTQETDVQWFSASMSWSLGECKGDKFNPFAETVLEHLVMVTEFLMAPVILNKAQDAQVELAI